MKNIITTLLFLFVAMNINAQITVSNNLYKVIYSESYQQPLELSYSYNSSDFVSSYMEPVSKLGFFKMDNGKYKPITYPTPSVTKTFSWETPEGIITSDDADYEDNDYDRGHLVPKKQFDDFKNISFLYSYLNYKSNRYIKFRD